MDETRVFNPLDLQISRSVYNWHHSVMGTCLAGRLIPVFGWNILPGTEIKMDLNSLFKMSTPVYPTMDMLYADVSFFFVPYKLVMSRRYASPSTNDIYESWEGFIGAQDFAVNMPVPSSGVLLPIAPGQFGGLYPAGCLGEYLYGSSQGDSFTSTQYPNAQFDNFYNALPFMSYLAIWNDNFREPNVQTPVTWNYVFATNTVKGNRYSVVVQSGPDFCFCGAESFYGTGLTNGSYQPWLATGGHFLTKLPPLPTSVFHGYFGSLLPWPQRNLTGVQLPVVGSGTAPVIGAATTHTVGQPLRITGGANIGSSGSGSLTPNEGIVSAYTQTGDNTYYLQVNGTQTNMVTDLSTAQFTGVNVEALRALITQQHWYEDIARSGNRLDELEYGTFGVRPKDSGLDRPLYLGGKRIPLNIEMVASTNGGTSATGAQGQTTTGTLGDLGAFSHTNDGDFYFHHGFDTWGCLMCVFTIRTSGLLASGIDRMWIKASREEWYWPEFANLGNFGVLVDESMQGSTSQGHGLSILGYQEYAEEWRVPRDRVLGLLHPSRSLGFMTYAHDFNGSDVATLPKVLDASRQFLDIDRTLAVASTSSGFQFIYQFTFDANVRLPIGKDSVPGVGRI